MAKTLRICFHDRCFDGTASAAVFSRFYRASNAGQADGAGAGLGLAITHSLVRLHGGKIWFESNTGRGSTFYVTFPVAS